MAAFNFHRRQTRRWWYAGATLVAAAFFAVFFVVGAGAVTDSPSNFESADGNMTLGTSGNTDWNCFVNSDDFAHNGSTPAGCAVTTGATQVTADAQGEVQWVNGQKFDTECPALNTGNNPPKDEFTHVAEYEEFASNGDLYFYGASIRPKTTGNVSGDVEFNQGSGDDVTTAGCRTAGDRLIAYDFLNGGTSLNFHVLTWIDADNPNLGGNSGKCLVKTDKLPCWGANVLTVSPGEFDGQASQGPIAAGDNGISNEALDTGAFAEFGINLTDALGGGPLPCFPQQVWESRSSGSSFTSNPQDIEFVHVSTCGALTISKTAKNASLGAGDHAQANVDFTVVGPSPSTASQTLTTGSDGTVCVENLGPGSYTVTETVPNGYKADSTNPQTVSVASGTTCDNPTTVNFHNTPLSKIYLGWHSLAGAGVTAATIQCTGESSASTFTDGGSTPTITKTLGNGTSTLTPGTHSCTVVIDP